MSEPLGLTLGTYGLGLLLRSADRRSSVLALCGLFALALSQAARPGALFVLPMIGCWIAWGAGATFSRRLLWLAVAAVTVVAGLGVLSGLNTLYGTKRNVSGSNFAYTMAGLAMGKNWKEVVDHYEADLARLPTEGEKARFLYAEAWRYARQQPTVMLNEFARALSMFGVELFPSVITFTEHAATRALRAARRIVLGVLFLLALIGTVSTMRRGNALPGLWLWGAAGVLASIPFVFLDGGWRIVAPVWPGMVSWFALSLAVPHRLVRFAAGLDAAERHAFGWRRLLQPARFHLAVLAAILMAAASGPWCGHALAARRIQAAAEHGGVAVRTVQLIPQFSEPALQLVNTQRLADVMRRGGEARRVRVLTWREFQRRLQHGRIEMSEEFRTAIGGPPAYFQQNYDAESEQLVWLAWPADRDPLLSTDSAPPRALAVEVIAEVPFIARLE